jgi:HSP20 family protein
MRQETHATAAPELPSAGLTANIYEDAGGDAYVVEVPAPGLEPEEIVIEVDAYSLVVRLKPRGTGSENGRTYLQRERSVSATSRVFDFPMEIDTENVEATLDSGILKIRLPKAAAGKRRVVRVARKETGAGPSKRAPESVSQRSPAQGGNPS